MHCDRHVRTDPQYREREANRPPERNELSSGHMHHITARLQREFHQEAVKQRLPNVRVEAILDLIEADIPEYYEGSNADALEAMFAYSGGAADRVPVLRYRTRCREGDEQRRLYILHCDVHNVHGDDAYNSYM